MRTQNALFQLGMDLDLDSSTAQTEVLSSTRGANSEQTAPQIGPKDFFVEREGVSYAGAHLIIDLWGAKRIDDLAHVEATLKACIEAAKATLLHIHLHHFTPNNGISGVAVLAESHISIHSWPERGYAALDVFMCGDAEPQAAVPVLREAFQPDRIVVEEYMRGRGV